MSEVNKETAMKIWVAAFGEKKWATDCFGTRIFKDDYGDREKIRLDPDGSGKKYSYGWGIDHIRPISDFSDEGNADFLNNYEPEHWQNNAEKSDKYPAFMIDGKEYTVVACNICASNGTKGYGILDKATKARVDWKAKTGKYFK